MKQIISIEENKDLVADKILCEWGEKHCCIAGWSSAQNSITKLDYFLFPLLTAAIVHQLMEKIEAYYSSEKNLIFSSAFPESLLIPAGLYKKDEAYTKALFDTKGIQLHDNIVQLQVVNAYTIPLFVYNEITARIPQTQFIHTYTAGLNVYNGYIANDSISVHFTPYNFRVSVKKGAQLQLLQMYPYQTPLDVVYYLLKITEELALPKDELSVVISGLIESPSALYEEINNYFQRVQFAVTPTVAHESIYPAHYFNAVYNLSACAL